VSDISFKFSVTLVCIFSSFVCCIALGFADNCVERLKVLVQVFFYILPVSFVKMYFVLLNWET